MFKNANQRQNVLNNRTNKNLAKKLIKIINKQEKI